jgi:Uma2 family endonuclease
MSSFVAFASLGEKREKGMVVLQGERSMSIVRTRHKFSFASYERLIDAGILRQSHGVELIRGEILEKPPNSELHAACVRKLTQLFGVRFAGRAVVSIQNPVRLTDSEPEPDVSLLAVREDYYATAHPEPQDVLLLVDVADASIDFDRDIKREIYAENGVAEFWILNLVDRTLEVYRQPQSTGRYADARVLSADEHVELERLPGETFAVSELFPIVK